MNLRKVIADSIKNSDNYFFFTDYNKQAIAVINDIKRANFIIVPRELNEQMINAAKNSIRYGNIKPSELVKIIYDSVIRASKF